MKVVLMVAEKPSVAETIAKKLGTGVKSRKAQNGIPVHEWDGPFRPPGKTVDERVLFRMTAVTGHVFGMDFPPEFNSWDKVDPAELFECRTILTESNEKQRVPGMLRSEGRSAHYLVLWLDCDKEGENICFEVVGILEETMGGLEPGKNLFRARFSALTGPDLKKAMQSLTVPNRNESLSVDARQELDLRIGCCFTRFQTKVFHGKYGSFDSTLISYGPCQTPTLGFCVKRHDIIQKFRPEKFWTIRVSVNLDSKEVSLEWERNRVFDKEIGEYFLQSIKECKQAVVSSCRKKECSKKRPVGLNTVEMLRLASSRLGLSPHHTMQVAERLYTQGYISYPRTETTHYPAEFDYKEVLTKFSRDSDWSDLVRWDEVVSPLKGHDAGDHSPITPLVAVSSRHFQDTDSCRLYEFIVKYFISTVCQDCVYLETTITFNLQNELFTFQGKEILKPGFTRVYPFNVISNSELIPEVTEHAKYPITEKKLHESETKPPDYLTESELITLMEKHGIGTDASIPVHINNICQRNYVKLTPGRKLEPTDLGIILVHGYLKIDPELVLPSMRSEVEKQLELIARGDASLIVVVKHTLDIFKAKFVYFVKNMSAMDDLFEVSFSKSAESGKPISRCGKCRRYMKLVSSNMSRLHCTNCNDTYNVPQGGNLRAFNDTRCPLDDFELISWSGGNATKSFTFCPYCMNNPPFPDMVKGSGCNNCTHPTCSFAFSQKGISVCGECDEGILVLDPASGPKWKIACNKCDVYVSVFEGSKRVIVLTEEKCDSCGSQCVGVVLPKVEAERKGCIYCTEEFEPFIEKRVSTNRRGGPSGRRGRGRGRGRGGRGRSGRGRGRGRS